MRDVDEECVANAIQTNSEGIGEKIGSWGFSGTCQDWVDDVLNACSDGEYSVETDDPEAYDNWYSPWFIDTHPPPAGSGAAGGNSGGDPSGGGDSSGPDDAYGTLWAGFPH